MAVSVNRIVAQDTVRQGEWAENFPVDDESVEWQQNVYRELFLTEGSNVGLFSPADQEGATTGLFACLFNIAMKDNINLYKYDIDGIEKLTKNSRVNIKDIFDDYHFPYKEDSLGNITFDKNDIPYADVKIFYLKEAMYYDISNSSFHKKVIALCPVLVLQDDFSGEPVRYPLFWTKYEEVEKYLHNIM